MAMVSASSAAASQFARTPSAITETTDSRRPIASASRGGTEPRGIGRMRGPRHLPVDVGVPPHVEGAAGARPRRHGGQRRDEPHAVERAGRERISDRAGEDDEGHDAGLEKDEMVDDAAAEPPGVGRPFAGSARPHAHARRRHALFRFPAAGLNRRGPPGSGRGPLFPQHAHGNACQAPTVRTTGPRVSSL